MPEPTCMAGQSTSVSGLRRRPVKHPPMCVTWQQWPVRIPDHHPAYIGWEEFVKNQEQLRQNWGRDQNRGVPREGRALLQGIVYCGVCGRKMSVQNRSVKEGRSPSYI